MNSKERFYWNGSRFVPSGTTVLPRPYLAQWAADCAVDYIIKDNCTTWEEVSETNPAGLLNFLQYITNDSVLAKARTAFLRESAEAADYGTYVHNLCEHYLTTGIQVESPHKLTQGFLEGFWQWVKKHNVVPIAMEYEVITDTYGGRLDLVCEMDSFWMTKKWCERFGHKWYKGINKQRVIVLVDFKTGKGIYYDNWKYQLAGYRQAWNEQVSNDYDNVPFQEKEENGEKILNEHLAKIIKHHGILKFNKQTGKVNYKDFTEYLATRSCANEPRLLNGKLPTDKYIRTYEMDRATFNSFVGNWWLVNRGIQI